MRPPAPNEYAAHWGLDPSIAYLNHGSFGACPKPVLAKQAQWRDRMERQPMTFFARHGFDLIDEARGKLAAFVGADAECLAFVPNATTAVSTVLRHLALSAGDQIVVTDHGYAACYNAVCLAAEAAGAEVVVVPLPFPPPSAEAIVDAVLAAVGPRTKLVLVDHVTSPTALVLPVAEIIAAVEATGVPVLVDGAHAIGMLDLDLSALGASYYTGNCHKWLCTPKGSALLYVRPDRQAGLHPLVISHGLTASHPSKSRFHLEFDWTGTVDPSAYLSVPAAIDWLGGLVGGGWPGLLARNRALALVGQAAVAEALGVEVVTDPQFIGSMASVPLPAGAPPVGLLDPLQDRLLEAHGVEVQISPWRSARVIRVSAQAYNSAEQYAHLAVCLRAEGFGRQA